MPVRPPVTEEWETVASPPAPLGGGFPPHGVRVAPASRPAPSPQVRRASPIGREPSADLGADSAREALMATAIA
jgi:hypothetical protein